MAVIALGTVIVWLAVVGAVRGYLHARATGDAGVRFRDRPGSAQWWARVLGTVGLVLLVAAPIAELAGLPALPVVDRRAVRLAGLGVAVAGVIGSALAQAAMGVSWRGDVDPEVQTALVTSGPFRWVRNPIFTASAATAVGIGMMVPNTVAVVALVVIVTTYQIQVRLVEEPYLRRAHGERYRAYAARTGRFLPLIGRLRRRPRPQPGPA
jgi:protein-S-isoprenylcysteine O-methyltransferase Ste14